MCQFSEPENLRFTCHNNFNSENFVSSTHSRISCLFTALYMVYENHCCNISQRLKSVAEAWPIKLTSTDLTPKQALSFSRSFLCVPTRTCSFNCSPPRGLVHREQLDRCRHYCYGQPKQWKLS